LARPTKTTNPTIMIWDRFDDAHDDLLDEIHESRSEAEALQKKLDEARVTYPEFRPPPSGNKPGPQGWYEDTMAEESSWSSYRDTLQKLSDERETGQA
jgi:hypothetical protein